MNLLDVVILLAAFSAAVGGWRLGFLARVTSWIGLGLGLYLAARLIPVIVGRMEGSPQVRVFVVALVVLLAGAFLGQALGLLVGGRLRLALPVGGQAQNVDRTGGALAGIVIVLAAVWLLAPLGAEVNGWPAEQIRNSTITRAVDRAFPAAPDALTTLRQVIGEDRFPKVFEALRPAPDLGAPPAASTLSAEVTAQVAASTVKIEAAACERIQEGSGSVVADGLVVTNAHVVAGAEQVAVSPGGDGERQRAVVVAFDPNRDLAVLSVPDIDRPPLVIADTGEGASGAVFGYPGGGPLEISPFVVGDRVKARGLDIYDERPTERDVLVLSAQLAPGDSGGALVNGNGQLVGVAFAIAPDRADVAYALSSGEVETVLAGGLGAEVDTGECLG
jgi:S1-C subfamily serine protease